MAALTISKRSQTLKKLPVCWIPCRYLKLMTKKITHSNIQVQPFHFISTRSHQILDVKHSGFLRSSTQLHVLKSLFVTVSTCMFKYTTFFFKLRYIRIKHMCFYLFMFQYEWILKLHNDNRNVSTLCALFFKLLFWRHYKLIFLYVYCIGIFCHSWKKSDKFFKKILTIFTVIVFITTFFVLLE